MLIELIRDNRKIVDRITPTQVTTYLYQLHDNKHYVLLNLLGVLCVCEDIAITNNQIQIAKELLEKHKVCRNNNLYVWWFNTFMCEHFLEDINPLCWVTDTPVLDFWWHLPWVSKQGRILLLACFVTYMQWIHQIHPWYNNCWLLGGKHGGWVVSIHILAYKHWWGSSPGSSMLSYSMWQDKRSTDWSKPAQLWWLNT